MSFIHIGNVLWMSDQMQYEAGNQLVSLSYFQRESFASRQVIQTEVLGACCNGDANMFAVGFH